MYNWQLPDWTDFKYDSKAIEEALYAFAEETAHVSGILRAMPENFKLETAISLMVSEAVKTSEIEGEYLSRADVLSSIRNNLGLNKIEEDVKDKKAGGAGALMVAVRESFAAPLTEEVLFRWHWMLMKDSGGITIGAWRTGKEPMQVISGAVGKEKIHFEAPPSSRVPEEMNRFIQWFNDTAPGGVKEIKKAPVRSAIAHLYFETIHPFEDGNGRIGRAVAEKALSQTIGRPVLLSLSQTIEANRKLYYAKLEKAQASNELTDWINYFVDLVLEAQRRAKETIDLTLRKAQFFDRYKDQLNGRQLKVLIKMFDAEPAGFEGGLTAKKYQAMTKASKATATRDIQLLAEMNILLTHGRGRSIYYSLKH